MTKTDFLKKCDINIIDIDVSETTDSNDFCAVDCIITLKKSTIVLTKGELLCLLSMIEKEEKFIKKHGYPSYIKPY